MLDSLSNIWRQKRNLLTLILGDFTQNHLASYLGFAWAIVGPLVSLFVMALVFKFGLKIQAVNTKGLSFVAWLTCGMVPWYYFSDGLQSGATAVVSYGFLVKKAVFRISYLPAIRLCSAALIHIALMVLLLCVVMLYGYWPSLYWFQWFYYFPLMFLFLLGVSWTTSALSVFIPDISSFLAVLLNLGFWVTPIIWNPATLPDAYHWAFSINPAYYITQGYRETFIEHQWFWNRPLMEHVSFFLWLAMVLTLGTCTFKKLRPHFADVI